MIILTLALASKHGSLIAEPCSPDDHYEEHLTSSVGWCLV
jgi:hypothetical protein